MCHFQTYYNGNTVWLVFTSGNIKSYFYFTVSLSFFDPIWTLQILSLFAKLIKTDLPADLTVSIFTVLILNNYKIHNHCSMTSDRKINAKITLSQLHCIPLNLINDIIFEYSSQDKNTPWWQNPGIYLWKTSNPQVHTCINFSKRKS